jgi:hypothetical protein
VRARQRAGHNPREISTVRALLPLLQPPGTAGLPVAQVFCSMLRRTSDDQIPAVIAHRDALQRRGLVAILEIDLLSAADQRTLLGLARDQVIDARGTPLGCRLVCHLDPRLGSFPPMAGIFAEVHVPPLGARAGDAASIASMVLSRRLRTNVDLEPEAIAVLSRVPWSGDLPELLGAIEHAARRLVERGVSRASADDFGIAAPPSSPPPVAPPRDADAHGTLKDHVATFEAEVIRGVMARLDGNKSQAARELGISRSYLIQKCKEHGID